MERELREEYTHTLMHSHYLPPGYGVVWDGNRIVRRVVEAKDHVDECAHRSCTVLCSAPCCLSMCAIKIVQRLLGPLRLEAYATYLRPVLVT